MLHVYNDKDSGTKAARMTDDEYALWAGDGYKAEYAGFWIKPKKDFGSSGYWDSHTRRHVKEGWVIVKDGCNAMPGATWAHNLAEAHQMIDCFLAVGEDGQKFHHLIRAINAVEPEPRKKQRGEVSFILGDPMQDDEEMQRYFEGVVGVIYDCSSYEGHCIYKEVTEHWGRDAYKQHGMGMMHTVGNVGDMPVCIEFSYNHIKGHKILFVHACSAVVDHRMVRKWLDENMPDTAFEGGDRSKRLNLSDPNNWHNAIPRD